MNTERIFVKDLNANDRYVMPGESVVRVCERRHTEANRTAVSYRFEGDSTVFEYVRVNLSTVDLII